MINQVLYYVHVAYATNVRKAALRHNRVVLRKITATVGTDGVTARHRKSMRLKSDGA